MTDSPKKKKKGLSALGHVFQSNKKGASNTGQEAQSSTSDGLTGQPLNTSDDTKSLTLSSESSKNSSYYKKARPTSEHSNPASGSDDRGNSLSGRSLPSDNHLAALTTQYRTALKSGDSSTEKKVTGDSVDAGGYDEQYVDVAATRAAIQYLDQKIVELRELLAKTQMERQNNVNAFLQHMDEHPMEAGGSSTTVTVSNTGGGGGGGVSSKLSKEQSKMRSAFEMGNKQSNKQEQQIQSNLECLEHYRKIVGVRGVPKGVSIKAHLKSLRRSGDKKLRSKMIEEVAKSTQSTDKKSRKHSPSSLQLGTRIKCPSNENIPKSYDKSNSALPGHLDVQERLGPGSLKDAGVYGGSTGALNTSAGSYTLPHLPQVTSVLQSGTLARHHPTEATQTKRSQTLPTTATTTTGNSVVNLPGVARPAGTLGGPLETLAATPSHHSTYTDGGKTSRSSMGDRDRERPHLDSSSLTGSISTEQELSVQLQLGGVLNSGIHLRMSEELQGLRTDLQLLDETSRRLEAQLKELQRNTKTNAEYSAQHIDSVAKKVDKLETRSDEYRQYTETKLQTHATNLQYLEGRFEYWMGNALRNLQDNIEGVENQMKQLENRVGNLAQRPAGSWWNQSDSSLQNHFITSLLHLLAFLAIVVSYVIQISLKAINATTHFMQHRSGLSLLLVVLLVGLALYHWSPTVERGVDTYLAQLWLWIQRHWSEKRT